MKRAACRLAFLCATLFATAGNAHAAFIQLISNGNFETGTFGGWTVQDLAGGSGTWFIDAPGTLTPLSSFSTVGTAANGSFYAVTDQTGPGTHVLLQSFVVPVNVVSMTLSFDLFANDQSNFPNINPAGLDHTAIPNQHARVDILTASAGAFSTSATDVVSNHYLGVDPGPNPNSFTTYSIGLTGLTPGATYQLRFGEVDNQLFFHMGVDNVSVLAETAETNVVPGPSGLILLATAIAPLGGYLGIRRRKRTATI